MSDLLDFFNENYKFIIAIVLSIIGLLVFISVYNINLETPKVDTKLAQVVTVETFEPNFVDDSINSGSAKFKKISNKGTGDGIDYTQLILTDGASNFCDKYSQSPDKLKAACNNISLKTCKNLPCCALLSTDTCVAANKYGPMTRTDADGKLIAMDHYYYLGTKYTVSQ